ncbi:hypothetical protein QAD02_003279 [Eretmocerus hayati]|uniref:Uncharacterized protein n=1 Tax=Eretmocerus hayati TaxID=131215 RepID=A0ACC2NLF4_9HYME|nr:hypothetical protein QAD02_003279 [Eretmocerus hayati]
MSMQYVQGGTRSCPSNKLGWRVDTPRPSGTVVPPVSVNSRPVNARRVEIVEESQSSEAESDSESASQRSGTSKRGLPVDPPYLPMPPQYPVGHRLLGANYRTLNRLTERNPELSRGETIWWDHDGIPFGIDDPRENRPHSNRTSCRDPKLKGGDPRDFSDDDPPPGYTLDSSRRRDPSLDSLSSDADQRGFQPNASRSRVPPTDSATANVNPRVTECASSRRPSRVESIPIASEMRERSPPTQAQRANMNANQSPRERSGDSYRNRAVSEQERGIPDHSQEPESRGVRSSAVPREREYYIEGSRSRVDPPTSHRGQREEILHPGGLESCGGRRVELERAGATSPGAEPGRAGVRDSTPSEDPA